MNAPFKNIGLAISFSPWGASLVKEAVRLKKLFNASLTLIHAGNVDGLLLDSIKEMITDAGLDPALVNIVSAEGPPSKVILRLAKEQNIDLLIAGALEKENFIKSYIGSVARTIMRRASSSVLIIPSQQQLTHGYKKFCVPVNFSAECETTVRRVYNFALLEEADQFILIREFKAPGLAMTIYDSGSSADAERLRMEWQKEEEGKLAAYLHELSLKGVPVTCECVYGDEGTEVKQYVKDLNDALLVLQAPANRNFITRLFPRNAELIFEKLPCPLLIVR